MKRVDPKWRNIDRYGALKQSSGRSWKMVVCFFRRHQWEPGAPLTVFSKRIEHFFEFRGCSRCGLIQGKTRPSERYG